MSPAAPPSDPFDTFPDVVAALAEAIAPVPLPARLKLRLDARVGEFVREREASFHLLSRPADRVRDRLLSAPEERRKAKGRPMARVVVSACGREAAFFCWYLPPCERFALAFERADGTPVPCGTIVTDGAGDGEIPYFTLPTGPPLSSVALRRVSSGATVLAARL